MTEDAWLATLIIFFIIPTILLSLRIYYDTMRYLRGGYMASSLTSLLFAIGSYIFFATACGMTLGRSRKRLLYMDRVGESEILPMDALGKPLSEATILHSYIVPTGLWLCKASFVAMYFNIKRHLNDRTKRLLYFTVFYLAMSFLVLILTHGLWCGRSFGKQWADTSHQYCTPFTSTVSISIYAFANISSDVLVLAIPLMILHYLTVLPRERYAIIFLLFLGLGTIVTTATCCALHITYRHELVVYYSFVQLAELLACVELSVALTAVSLPSLRAVLYRKQERRRRHEQGKLSAGTGAGTRGSRTGHTSGGTDTGLHYHGDNEDSSSAENGIHMGAAVGGRVGRLRGEEDENRLVPSRRMSNDVESVGSSPPPPPISEPLR